MHTFVLFRSRMRILALASALACSFACGGGDSTSPTGPVTPKNLSLRFCTDDYPIWVAAQPESGKWIQVKPDGDGVFRVAIGAGGGLAFVTPSKDMEVTYASVDELARMFGACQSAVGGKTIRGDVVGLNNENARISLGSSQSGISDLGQFELRGVKSGPRDLIATRFADIRSYSVSSLVIRRSIDVADGTRLPPINFNSTEAFAPVAATLTLQNFESLSEVWLDLFPANGSQHGVYYAPQGLARQTYVGVPSSRLAVGDVQLLEAFDNVGVFEDISRVVSAAVIGVADQTLTFGPPISRPAVSAITGATHPRWHAVLPVQSEYSSLVVAGFSDRTGRSTLIVGSEAYIPKTGGNWDIAIPDFSAIGFDSSLGLQADPTTEWFVFAAGGASSLSNRTPGSVIRGSSRRGGVGIPFDRRPPPKSRLMSDLIRQVRTRVR